MNFWLIEILLDKCVKESIGATESELIHGLELLHQLEPEIAQIFGFAR